MKSPAKIKSLHRRRLVAAGAALGAGALMKDASKPAEAGHDGTNVCHLGTVNRSSGPTYIENEVFHPLVGESLAPPENDAYGLFGRSKWSDGVYGLARNFPELPPGQPGKRIGGVHGFTSHQKMSGVIGENLGTDGLGPAVGVTGRSPQTGVYGESIGNGYGVHGQSNYLGVFGNGESYGVLGISRDRGVFGSGPSAGVTGVSDTGAGVFGQSGGVGMRGEGTASGSIGVAGISAEGTGVNAYSQNGISIYAASDSSYALYARSGGKYVAYFNGSIYVAGEIVTTSVKAAAVSHPDGSHRQLFGLSCPEPRLEEFGEGQLTGGRTEVVVDPDFAALLGDGSYQVFLSPYDDCRGLYVGERRAGSFVVRELQGGTSQARFGYRLVAEPRQASAARLERVELPAAPTVRGPAEPLPLPDLPEMPPFRPEPIQPPNLPAPPTGRPG